MQDYVVTVTPIIDRENLDSNDLLEDGSVICEGRWLVRLVGPGADEKAALDQFHVQVPIHVLDDFDISVAPCATIDEEELLTFSRVLSDRPLSLQEGNRMPAHVRRILDISTAHLTPKTRLKLDGEDSWEMDIPIPVVHHDKGEYGWIVYVPSEPGNEELPGFPPDLRNAMVLARHYSCDWVMFDRDGVVVDALYDYEDY